MGADWEALIRAMRTAVWGVWPLAVLGCAAADARYLGLRSEPGARWNWAPAARVLTVAVLAGVALGLAAGDPAAAALVGAGCALAGAWRSRLGLDPHGRWQWAPAAGVNGLAGAVGVVSGLAVGRFADAVYIASAVYLVVRLVALVWLGRRTSPDGAALWAAGSGAIASCIGVAAWLGLSDLIAGAAMAPPAV